MQLFQILCYFSIDALFMRFKTLLCINVSFLPFLREMLKTSTPGKIGHFFQEPQMSAIDRFDCIYNFRIKNVNDNAKRYETVFFKALAEKQMQGANQSFLQRIK